MHVFVSQCALVWNLILLLDRPYNFKSDGADPLPIYDNQCSIVIYATNCTCTHFWYARVQMWMTLNVTSIHSRSNITVQLDSYIWVPISVQLYHICCNVILRIHLRVTLNFTFQSYPRPNLMVPPCMTSFPCSLVTCPSWDIRNLNMGDLKHHLSRSQ